MTKENIWKIDNLYSEASLKTPHAIASTVTGNFQDFEGQMSIGKDNLEDASFEFSADVNSLDISDKQEDIDIKCSTYFDAKAFPKLHFKASKFKQIADKRYTVTGDLKIKDTTKKVDFDMHYFGLIKDQHGNEKIAIDAKCTFNMDDYNMKTGFDKDNENRNIELFVKAQLRDNS